MNPLAPSYLELPTPNSSKKKVEHIVVPLSFLHKLNYFSLCRNFEILFLILCQIFHCQVWNADLQKQQLKNSGSLKHTKLFKNIRAYLLFCITISEFCTFCSASLILFAFILSDLSLNVCFSSYLCLLSFLLTLHGICK